MSSDSGNNLSKSDEQIINEAEQNLNSRPMVQGDVRKGAGRPEQSSTGESVEAALTVFRLFLCIESIVTGILLPSSRIWC